ncbi:2547_t:CDS:2 [Funneliformis geosporum]|nr:2547_t:CDS:2 [Funneliformis geosporum]
MEDVRHRTHIDLQRLVLVYNDRKYPSEYYYMKSIEEAQLKIIKEALRIHYKKDSKLVTEYANYVQILRQEKNPDEIKKELLASIENLYSLYYTLSKEECPMTEDEISKTIEELIVYNDE